MSVLITRFSEADLKQAFQAVANNEFYLPINFKPPNCTWRHKSKCIDAWDDWGRKTYIEEIPKYNAYWCSLVSYVKRINKLKKLRDISPDFCLKKDKNVKADENRLEYYRRLRRSYRKRKNNKRNGKTGNICGATGGIFAQIQRDAAADRYLMSANKL